MMRALATLLIAAAALAPTAEAGRMFAPFNITVADPLPIVAWAAGIGALPGRGSVSFALPVPDNEPCAVTESTLQVADAGTGQASSRAFRLGEQGALPALPPGDYALRVSGRGKPCSEERRVFEASDAPAGINLTVTQDNTTATWYPRPGVRASLTAGPA